MTEEIGARLSLKDRAKFSSEAERAAEDVEDIGRSAEKAESKAKGLGSTLGTLGGGLKTVGGLAIKTGAVLGGVAAAGIGAFAAMGVQAYAAAEQAEISFTTMLGGAEEAKAFLSDLEQFAASTPFEMQGLTSAAQGLIAFGFEAKEVLPMMTAIGDAAAGLGAGEEGMDRMVRAMGQIQAKGKATSEDLMQLAELGVPVWDILAEKLGTTVPQAMEMVTKGQVDAATTIDGLLTGMDKRFGGLMDAQSQSVSGLWSTLGDNIRITSKKAIEPFAGDIKNAMRFGIGYAEDLGAWFETRFPAYIETAKGALPGLWDALQAGDAGAIGESLDTIFGDTGNLTGPITEIVTVVQDLWTVFSDLLLPTVMDLSGALPALASPLLLAKDLLGFVADNAETLQPYLTALVIGFVAYKAALTAANIVIGINTMLTNVNAASTKKWLAGTAIAKAATILWTGAMAALNFVMAMNPIALVVLAIVALVAIFVVAYKKSETFRNIVNGALNGVKNAAMFVWNWFKKNWPLLLAILTGPFGIAVYMIVKHWDKIKAGAGAVKDFVVEKFNTLVGFFKSLPGRIADKASGMWDGIKSSFVGVINFIIDAWNSVDFSISVTAPDWVPGFGGKGWQVDDIVPDIPRLHTGGRTTTGGAAIIQPDEEMVVLPPAASVIPTPEGRIASEVFGGGNGSGTIVVPVYINGKKVMEAVHQSTRDEVARR